MKHPIVLALGAGLVVMVAAFVAPLLHMGRGQAPAPEQGLPWQAAAQADGTLQVFGLALGRDTLADAQRRLGDDLRVAVVARLGEVGTLEALADPFAAGFVSGRLVLAFEVAPDMLADWRERALRSEPMDGGLRRFELTPGDRATALAATIAGLSFVPTLRLSEQDIPQRFGAPAEVVALAGSTQVLLYPDRGLAATVAEGSRGVLEYVAPREFEARLRKPLLAAIAAAAAASSASR